jgi:hypothetical protein
MPIPNRMTVVGAPAIQSEIIAATADLPPFGERTSVSTGTILGASGHSDKCNLALWSVVASGEHVEGSRLGYRLRKGHGLALTKKSGVRLNRLCSSILISLEVARGECGEL